MDPLSLFSPEELSTWADKRFIGNMLFLTAKTIRLTFYITVLWAGLHVVIRNRCESMADWLYARPGLKAAGLRVPLLKRLLHIPEKLASGASGQGNNRWLVDALFPVVFGLLWMILILPFDFYGSYVRPHAVGMSNLSLSQFFSDMGRSMAIYLPTVALLGLGLFGLARRLPRTWWLWLGGSVVGVLVLWSMLAPARATLYNEFEDLPKGSLRTSIENLATQAGFEIKQIQVVDTSRRSKATVAYIMGRGPTRTVVLSDNLLNEYNPREILFTVAHELGHELRAHEGRAWLSTAFGALIFLGLIQLILRRGPRIKALRLRPDADPAAWPVVLLILHLLFTLNTPISRSISRGEEWEADQAGLELTRDPVAYVSLMARLARQNKADLHPPWFIRKFMGSHPSLKERMQYGLDWAQAHGISIGPGALPLPAPEAPLVESKAPKKNPA